MVNKISFSLLVSLIFLFSVNFALARTCSDPTDPVSETGRCLSACDPATEHQISGTCMGQVCCVTNPTSGFPTDTAPTNSDASTGKKAGEKCNLTSECTNGLTCHTASGETEATCQVSSYAGDTAPTSTSGTASSGSMGAAASGGWSLGNISGFGLPAGSVFRIITNILVWLLGLFGIIGILGFLISGIIYLTAAGDEDRMGYAKRAMQYSIIGVIVGLIGFVIIQAIDYALNTYSSF